MQRDIPFTRDLVLIGGGHAHALFLRAWGMNPLAGARVTLINPHVTAPYTGMLPGYIAGHYERDDLDIDLVRLARFAGARLVLDLAIGLDLDAKTVQLSGRPDIAFDTLSIDIGITSDLPAIDGFSTYGVAAKPLGQYARAWDAFIAKAVERGDTAYITVIGAGVAGVELALAMAHRLDSAGVVDRVITLVEARDDPLTALPSSARRKLLRALQDANITIKTRAHVIGLIATHIVLSDHKIRSDFTVSAAGARPHTWLSDTALTLHQGYIEVGETLQSTSHKDVFAVGDCAHLSHAPRPKAGVFAVREAPILLNNLRASLSGGAMQAFKPQRDYLKLISLGRQSAVGSKFGIALSGRSLWRIKDRIDRAFMDKFCTYPDMKPPHVLQDAASGVHAAMDDKYPLCGGCGAKVGAATLYESLKSLPKPKRTDIITGIGDDAAVLTIGETRQVITVDHLRAFAHDPYVMARIAAIHAFGDIWAMGAAPQLGLASITLPKMSPELQARTLSEIMKAAGEVFHAAGAEIAGGHTSIGAELCLGFTVTGICPADPIRQNGAQAGDAILLTKPIGTGIILAAEMRGAAYGGDVAAAYEHMSADLGGAAHILANAATAMTDVTGFGLAGHVLAILKASGLGADLDLDVVPLLHGALRLSQQGIQSSLWPDNYAASAPNMSGRLDDDRAALLFDPQTAGGMLATVPEHDVDAILERLSGADIAAIQIGRVKAGAAHLHII